MVHPLHKTFYQQGCAFSPFCYVVEKEGEAGNGLMARVMCGSRYC